MCFSEDPSGPGTFPRGVFFVFCFQILPSLPLSYPRGDGDDDGDRFPKKIYIPPRGELRGYHGIL